MAEAISAISAVAIAPGYVRWNSGVPLGLERKCAAS
jgi:hypothetical protein